MNNIGFPNTDIYSEHEQGGGESFWPSFTDIMMVIVMVFLMITVAVILNNWELINNLKSSVAAERQAMAKAQSALQVVQVKSKENETLEQRLARLESLLSTRTGELQQTRQQQHQTLQSLQVSKQEVETAQAAIQDLQQKGTQSAAALAMVKQSLDEQKQQIVLLQQEKDESVTASASLQKALDEQKQQLVALQQEKDENVTASAGLQKTLEEQKQQVATLQQEKEMRATTSEHLQKELEQQKQQVTTLQQERDEKLTASKQAQEKLASVSEELENIQQNVRDGHEQLLSLQGDYDSLDNKYQKLLRPARSAKNKHIVRVIFHKNNGRYSYQLGDQEESLRTLSRKNLEKALDQLKQKYAADLYVKIIIPESSTVSHAEAWKFTNEILTKYDYYRLGEE